MIEFIVIGFVFGLAVGVFLSKKSFMRLLKYKAETGIDLNEDGTFYTIIYSERNK